MAARKPSVRGLEIEAAILADGSYVRHQDERLYLGVFRTAAGTVFAVERVTIDFIRMWLLPTPAVEAAVAAERILVPALSLPNSKPDDPNLYGRLSSLEQVPELEREALLPVKVTSAPQAMRILAALV
jgi:hypothetical protein